MKNARKFMPFLLIIALLLSGCSKTDSGSEPKSTDAEEPVYENDAEENSVDEEEPIAEDAKSDFFTDFTEPVTLVVDFHGYTPSINTEPTADNPTVFLSPQKIADKFMELHPNVTIEWARTKPIGTADEAAEWFTTQLNGGTCPAIVYTWGSTFASRSWYKDLGEYLDLPNPYIEGNEQWRDIFPEYLWTNQACIDGNKNIVSIPVTLYSGPATGYYYNKDAFKACGIEKIPTTLEELIDTCSILKENGYIALAPHPYFVNVATNQWIESFICGPTASAYIQEQCDYDGDGEVTEHERLHATKDGLFDPVQHDYAKEYWRQLYRYYTEVLEEGWENTDYQTLWNEGKVGLFEDGLWRLTSENNNTVRECEYGIFPEVVMSTDTTEYAAEVDYSKGPYQPDPDLALNIMSDVVKDDPLMMEAAIRFLMFLTVPENVTEICQENGTVLGAVKGTQAPAQLNEWVQLDFPKVPKTQWPSGYTSEYTAQLDKTLETWVKGDMTEEEFFEKVNAIQQAGADDYIKTLGLDTSSWE